MDQNLLVEQAHGLVAELDSTRAKPRAVLWVHHEDTDVWKLWITPAVGVEDKREFYRLVAEAITKAAEKVRGLDIGSTEFVAADNPAMQGLKRFMRVEGTSSVYFTGNRFDGIYLPDGIIIRMML